MAAAHTYEVWRRFGAYVCQPNRTFRAVRHWGFYRNKCIEPEFPRLLRAHDVVTFDEATAAQLDNGDPVDQRLAQFIRELLVDGETPDGDQRGVYLLQRHDDPDLPQREQPLPHREPGSWTQGQRYASLEKLLAADTTADP